MGGTEGMNDDAAASRFWVDGPAVETWNGWEKGRGECGFNPASGPARSSFQRLCFLKEVRHGTVSTSAPSARPQARQRQTSSRHEDGTSPGSLLSCSRWPPRAVSPTKGDAERQRQASPLAAGITSPMDAGFELCGSSSLQPPASRPVLHVGGRQDLAGGCGGCGEALGKTVCHLVSSTDNLGMELCTVRRNDRSDGGVVGPAIRRAEHRQRQGRAECFGFAVTTLH
ncbi:hypothetical protein K456DRAFT_1479560 [Colletotrichum gloeosporioides 23]|nr:hypothetical protein K456DRAFT_1479560 [Colletotrichum gloeosporioides 23]